MNIETEIKKIIKRVLELHTEFEYEEVEELCNDFLNKLPKKVKKLETRIKQLNNFITKEFELDKKEVVLKKETNKKYCLETIPKYLFEGKSDIKSGLINITNLTKNIGVTELFKGANFKINTKDKIALIGNNGTGKTTLLKIIINNAGIDINNNSNSSTEKNKELDQVLEIQDGKVEIAKGLKIGYLSQDLFWKSEKNTLREEMLEIFPEITSKIKELKELKIETDLKPVLTDIKQDRINNLNKELLKVDGFRKYELQLNILKYFGIKEEQLDLNVLKLSGGEQTKIQIAKFLIQEVDLLILDEPTNHLDIEGILFLEKFCKNWKKAILSISHDVRFIDNTSDKIAEISDKQINIFYGKYNNYLKLKQDKYNLDLKNYNIQQKELEKQNDYINRFRSKASKAKGVQSRIKAINKIKKLEQPKNSLLVGNIDIKLEKRLPEIIMKLNNIEVGYSKENILFKLPDELIVNKSDKIGIIGKNGAGKTTLLKTILGELKPIKGTSEINENILVGSYSQVLDDLDKNISVIDELFKDHDNQKEIRTMLGGLLIRGDKVKQKISSLSGGERAKVALTKMLLTRPHIIVMDEPTNHLDLNSKEVIKNMLDKFEGTTLIVSHDRDLLENISNKLWVIKDKKLEIYDEPEVGFRSIF